MLPFNLDAIKPAPIVGFPCIMCIPVIAANGGIPISCPAWILTIAWAADFVSANIPLSANALAKFINSDIGNCCTIETCVFILLVFSYY
jgi:hypothetical protein